MLRRCTRRCVRPGRRGPRARSRCPWRGGSRAGRCRCGRGSGPGAGGWRWACRRATRSCDRSRSRDRLQGHGVFQAGGRVSAQGPHQSGSPGGPAPRRASAQPVVPRGASAQARLRSAGCPAGARAVASNRAVVMLRFIRAGSATSGGSGPPGGRARRAPAGLAQPWPIAMPSGSVTVTQMVVWGLRVAVAARVRQRAGSRVPRPCPSRGRSAWPRRVASGRSGRSGSLAGRWEAAGRRSRGRRGRSREPPPGPHHPDRHVRLPPSWSPAVRSAPPDPPPGRRRRVRRCPVRRRPVRRRGKSSSGSSSSV